MIDIHCHILYDIDDGPEDIEESIEMAKTAFEDGITTIVATPHVKDSLIAIHEIQQRIDELNSRLRENGIPVTILRGADVSSAIPLSFLKDYAIQGTNYILIEFPHTYLPSNAGDLVFNMILNGLRPIITHPERNPSIVRNIDLILSLFNAGALVQITAGSLTGDFGIDAKECATHLLRVGAVNFLATDAHSNSWRMPILSEGLKIAEKIIGIENARRLVTTNPEAVINGRNVNAA